ncbi:telomerase protein component 1 isoform X3 [Hemicordylus capensis]|uniref:telomerase protein component 1 isoform X3 n=1 Tax=Hemicordylus capensis TaxID=884348 RepID=UPI00230395B7|nr:telomerase protein component 1 isoform X3 [Hemicordylus capensis]
MQKVELSKATFSAALSARLMDLTASHWAEKPFLPASSPVAFTLQGLEESRARLLHPITPSASWQALLNPPSTQSELWPGHLTKTSSLSILDCKPSSGVPEQAQVAPAARRAAQRPPFNSDFCEPNSFWLENPFLKQPTPTPLALQGFEEARARLLRPLDTQQRFPSDAKEKLCVWTSMGLPPDHSVQGEVPGSCGELEPPWEGDEDSSGAMPDYVLTVPEDLMGEQPEEREPLGEEMPMECEEQNVRELKLMLVSLACCSLVEVPKFESQAGNLQLALEDVCGKLAERDPEFILKVALYTRQELNIRSTANFLLALASRLLPCRPHLRRYFCHTVQLPSDWMEVARLYQVLGRHGKALVPMPSCLRTAMADKFRQFDAYQLAKYNTRKSRGKKRHRPKTEKALFSKGSRHEHWKKHALGRNRLLAPKLEALQKKFQQDTQLKQSQSPAYLFSLKTLIQRLHICEPAQHVMSLLGRRYPSDLNAFSRSRLPGPWDSSLAGTRMKLPKPHTWDRELSQHGNNATAWEGLIDAGKLPFMAMLRNLRNILRAGVSERYHKCLLKRLEDKESVIRSKQLPFRFLSAYKVIEQLEKNLKEKAEPRPSNTNIIRQILKRFISSSPETDWTRRVLRSCMEVPVIFQLVKCEKKKLLKPRPVLYSHNLLQRYRQALETAIRIAIRHNVPPIPGRTLILIACTPTMNEPYRQAQDLCWPDLGQEDGSKRSNRPLTKLDMAMLLSSMVYAASEQAEVFLSSETCPTGRPVPMTGSVLEDVRNLQAQEIPCCNNNKEVSGVIMGLLARRQHVDTILVLSSERKNTFDGSYLPLYRHHVAPGCLFVNVCANAREWHDFSSRNEVVLSGFSEQVLRFMAKCGDSRFLEHIGKIDELHGLPKKQRVATAEEESGAVPLMAVPKSRWRSVRVFVSSTFRDMHGERDLLIRSVFPELRSRAAAFCLAIEEIDLRWGITEHEAQRNKQLELCLSEVSRSHLFIGILGERYGHVPQEYSLPDEPQYEWVKSYPAGRSITELEAVQFLNSCNDPAAGSRAFFYLREPDFLDSVPETWKADFAAESEEAEHHMAALKERLGKHEGLASLDRYTCQWGGVVQGRPYVKGLQDFGAKVLQDVWESLRHQFIEADGTILSSNSEEQEGMALQESFQELQQRRCCARGKLLSATAAQLCGGRLYLVSGPPGQGKTVFLAALAQELRTKGRPPSDSARSYHVVAHFTRARPDQAQAQVMLAHLCALLRKQLKEPPAPPRSYRGLVSQFESLLISVAQSLKRHQSLVVLIDGADLIHAASGHLISDWLPEQLPQRVSLVLSVSEDSALLGSLKRRKDVIAIPLGPLAPPDRVAVVRKDLALYGKKLEESAFNNQMRLVLLKRGSWQPLYLTLLTQDLRLFALYEKLSERIQKLPVSLPSLLQHLLGCLEQDHGLELVAVALVSLWASRDGLTEQDLYAILAMWRELNGGDINVEQAIISRRPAGCYPMASFFDFLRSLRGLLGACGSPLEHLGSRLHLSGAPLRMAVERRYLKKPGLDHTAHTLLAAHWWKLADPDGSRSFRNCEAEALTALPYHLVQSGHFSILASFLTDLRVVSAHVHQRLLHCLSEAYALYDISSGSEHDDTVDSFRDFLQKNMELLSLNPGLLLQQAVNEPDSSALCVQAEAVLSGNGRSFLKWVNKPQKAQETKSRVLTLPAKPSCASVAPSGSLAVVGTAEGTLHLMDMETGQELKSLLSACDGVSACEFLSETTVCLGAFNGRLELWSLREGCRLMGTDAHKAQITDCCTNSDRKLLATVSLDSYLKLWESTHGHLTHERDCSCPLNCVTFHPKGHLVATGGWDRTVTILDVNDMSVTSVLKDHDASIHSISFSSAGNILAAGSLAGSVHLWSWCEAVNLGTFSAHSGCISATLFLPGGKLLTAGEDCKVQLWSGHLGQLWSTLRSEALSPALCLAPSPDGSRLAVGHHSDDVWVYSHPWRLNADPTHCTASGVAICSLAWLDHLFLVGGSNDGSLCIWNTLDPHPSCLHKLQGHDGAVMGLAASKHLLASTSEDFTVCLWLTDTLRPGPAMDSKASPLAILRGHTAGVTCCAFSLDGSYLATGGKDRALFLWDVRDPSKKTPSLWRSLPFCHQDWISSCAWAGPLLLSGSNDCTVCLWDPKTGQRLQEFLGHQSPICGVASEKDLVISVGRDGTLVAWDMQGVERTQFLAHPGQANHCAGFRDPLSGGKAFILAAAGSDGTVNLWKPLMVEEPQSLSGHCAAICGAAASPASSSFLTISEDKTARMWTVPMEKAGSTQDHPPHHGAVTALAWSPDGEFAASGGESGDLVIWRGARAVGAATVGPHCIRALAFTSPLTVLVASDGISLWDINVSRENDRMVSLTHRKLLRRAGETALVLCTGVSKPCGSVVMGLSDGSLLVLQAGTESFHTKNESRKEDYVISVSFDIAVSEEGILHIWDNVDRPTLSRMKVTKSGELEKTQDVSYIAWTPKRPSDWVTVARMIKEKSLLCGDSEGALWTRKLWETDAWQRRKIHSDKITALHVLGDRFVTASHDQDVKIWDHNTMKLLGQFRCRAPISQLQPCPTSNSLPLFIVGDTLGNIYFLEWGSISV